MSGKRGKKSGPTKGKGDRMSERETGATAGAGYEDTSATGEIKEAASDVVDTAQSAVASAAETVQQTASAVVDTAQQATSAVTGVVADKVGQVGDAAAGKVEQLADTVAQTAGSADVSEGTRQVAATTVNVLDRTAEYLRDGDLGVVVEDLRSVVRRHPLRSLVVGLGLGYLARSTFFPASSTSAGRQSSSRPGGTPYTPTFQEVPVYRGDTYGSTSMGNMSNSASMGDTALGLGTMGMAGDTALGLGSAGMGGTALGLDNDALDMERMSVGDDALGIDTMSMGGDLDSISTDDALGTMSLDDALGGLDISGDVDTVGLGSDETSAYMGGTAVDMLDVSDTDDALGDMGGMSDMGSLGVGSDNELLAGDALDAADTDMSSASGDDVPRSANASTMPTDDLLRQWDDSTSGSGQSS